MLLASAIEDARDFLQRRAVSSQKWGSLMAQPASHTSIWPSAHSLYGPDTVRPIIVANTKKATRMIVSSLATYSSLEMASADNPVPSVTQPVFVTSELPGRMSSRAEARDSGEGSGEARSDHVRKPSTSHACKAHCLRRIGHHWGGKLRQHCAHRAERSLPPRQDAPSSRSSKSHSRKGGAQSGGAQ